MVGDVTRWEMDKAHTHTDKNKKKKTTRKNVVKQIKAEKGGTVLKGN